MRTMGSSATLTLAIAAILAPGAGEAQESPSAARNKLEEITVTASRREERIVDVPYAITAIGGGEIGERAVVDIKDLQYSIPGLQMNESLFAGADRVALRGVEAGAGTGLPVVGVYVDDVGVSVDQQQREAYFPLVDLERVEVLRGPQGTLYGQGSVSGTIRYITRSPSLESTDGFVDGTVYQQDKGDPGYRLSGAFGGPIVEDKLGLRVVAGYDRRAGWIDYPNADVKDANEIDTSFVRGKLLWQATDGVKVTLLYQYTDLEADAGNATDAGTNEVSSDTYPEPSADEGHLANAIIDIDTGLGLLTLSSGYLKRDLSYVAAGQELGGLGALFKGLAFETEFEQFTQEIRLASSADGPFRYVFGAWYRDFESYGERTVLLPSLLPPALLARTGTDPVDSEALALFGDVTWAFSDKLEASVGLRYYEDDRESRNVDGFGNATSVDASFDSTSPRFNLLYKWNDDFSTYFTAAKGFRSGGFNFDNSTFDAEDLWSYEVGTKAALLDGSLYLDGAVYFLDYSNRQSAQFVPPFAVTGNGGEASGPGIELALSSRLPYELSIDASLSYNNLEYDNTTFEADKGEPFNFIPAFTGALSVSQRFPLGASSLRGLWRVDFQYADSFDVVVRQPIAGERVTVFDETTDSQELLNLQVGIEAERYTVTVGVQNLLDEDAQVFPNVFVPNAGVRVRPMSYMLSFRYNWD